MPADQVEAAAVASGSSRNSGLDAIRVGAAFSVFAFHAQISGVDHGLFRYGSVGVAAFFVLSGYLIYTPFLRHPVSTPRFLLRRGARIGPASAFMFCFVVLFLAPLAPLGTSVLWSLVIEAGFYALLPVLAILIGGRLRGVAVFVACSLVIDLVALSRGYWDTTPPLWFLPTILWMFGLGMAVAVVQSNRPQLLKMKWLLPAGIVGVVAGLETGPGIMLDWPTALGTALLVAFFAGRPLHSRTLSYAAELSFPFYLWHVVAIAVVISLGASGVPLVVWAFGLALVISMGSVRYLERPAIRLSTRLASGRRGLRHGREDAAAE
jgi:peptidoglycan/LPS O-acetylase OafA/YrhL